uniref:PiggyBac transposable element-derived protein domain-containing protein n=1 Tax=Graphocephala atropunctata TaxID=36148 RepID=A0A1B6LFF4_9HEMI
MASTSRNIDNVNNSDDSDFVPESDETSVEDSSDISDAEDEPRVYNPVWSPNTAGLRQIPFTEENRLKVSIPGNNKPIDWFYLLFDIILLENIVRETNRYARLVYFSPTLMPKSRINNWRDVTTQELKTFIGILFHMGTVRLNRINDYWKTGRFFNFPVVREQMSRDRFLLILRCIHFADNSKASNDRLMKVRLLVDYFNAKMDAVYYPCRELSLDEGMILWRGRLFFRQYIKGKRHKYGIKVYSLCEPHGLAVRLTIYSGSDGELSGHGHASKVVLHLMRGKLSNGHALFMDNYYNSFPLASELLSQKTYCTGTLRLDRKHLPEDVKNSKLKKGETIAAYAQGVMVAKWKDRRVVAYISTEFKNTMAISVNRRQVQREKPLPIVQYNANMKGVDRNDQLMSYYPMEHKSLRWYKKVFVHMLQMIMVNAYKLHNFANLDTSMSFYDFRLEVIAALLPEREQPAPVRPPKNPMHVLSKTYKRDAKGNLVRIRCRVCLQEGRKDSKTVYICAQCPGEPALCPIGCYEKYHAPK